MPSNLIPSRDRKVVVIGQGYVGLPVAMRAVEVGFSVVGIDIDERRVAGLQQGVSYVDDISNDTLSAALASGAYVASHEYSVAADFDFAVITVPTPLKDSHPDLTYIEEAAAALAPHVRPGATVVLESTTYPGTTVELFVPILEQGSGLSAETDFHVGYSPERIDPGNPTFGFVNTPKVVSGHGSAALDSVDAFYSTLVDRTVRVATPAEAELTKLIENTFRHVNIALVNELATFAHQLGVDIWQAIDAAATKPFGYMKFTPGPGVGGHCLPVDPSYLSWQVRRKLGKQFRFVELANDVNDHMPDYVVQRSQAMLNAIERSIKGSKIMLVGLAYKANTGDIRESPALRLIELLLDLGANLTGVDSHVEEYRWPRGVAVGELTEQSVSEQHLVIVLTQHSDVDLDPLRSTSTLVLDTKNLLPGTGAQPL
ncbi:nucleotide sugar dehydrogenase [Micrococcales bacterium 31B]|nr:nucleotide sugar dehydrogenase [Micrococcales bacterium 31B]